MGGHPMLGHCVRDDDDRLVERMPAAPTVGQVEEPAPDDVHPDALVDVAEVPVVRLAQAELDVRVEARELEVTTVERGEEVIEADSFGPAM
jgi:hypothetical protein